MAEVRGHVETICIERKALDKYGAHNGSIWEAVDFKVADGGEGLWVVLCAQ